MPLTNQVHLRSIALKIANRQDVLLLTMLLQLLQAATSCLNGLVQRPKVLWSVTATAGSHLQS